MTTTEHPKPPRVQRQRTRAWRKPAAAVIVDRTTRYGNPWPVPTGSDASRRHAVAVDAYRRWLSGEHPDTQTRGLRVDDRRWILAHVHELAGRPLCWTCPPEMSCHADAFTRLSNLRCPEVRA